MTSNNNKKVTERTAPISVEQFPNPSVNGKKPACTIANLAYLLDQHAIKVEYDVIAKKVCINIPGHSGSIDNENNVLMSHMVSLAAQYGMNTQHVPEYIDAIADRNELNRVLDWIESKPWDGEDRLPAFYETLTTEESFPKEMKETLIYCWMLSAVAAAKMPAGFKARGVLTLQGEQSIGKTSWIQALIPNGVLRQRVIKLDHHLDAANKDSIITAISHWIVEVGELDSSFKKDVARLKGFLTSDSDKIRKPYARANMETARKTVFIATVNERQFLVDSTGNTRFWTLPVKTINYQHGLDMQQIFAQLLCDFNKQKPWWLTSDQEKQLEVLNKSHQMPSAIEELILDLVDLKREKKVIMSAKDLLERGGIKLPSNPQFKEANAVLTKLLGAQSRKKYEGQYKWHVPLKDPDDLSFDHQFNKQFEAVEAV